MNGPLGQDHAQAVRRACDVVTRALGDAAKRPQVTSFFDEPTNTVSHIVRGPASRRCGVIDAVLDYHAASGRTATESADELITFIRERSEDEFVRVRTARDAKLCMPKLILPSLGGRDRDARLPTRRPRRPPGGPSPPPALPGFLGTTGLSATAIG